MHVSGYCPQCNTEISSDRHLTGYAICRCGWYDKTPNAIYDRKQEKKIITSLAMAAVFVALLYGHMLNWGAYAFSIPIVKIEQMTGTLSKQGYEDLAKACIQLNKWSCAKTAYVDLFHQTGDAEGLAELAHLEVRLNEKELAMTTYASYFRVGGKNSDSAIEYGDLLQENSQLDAALKYYEQAIVLRPQVLPVNATTSIVRLLIKTGRYEEAYQRILDFHASAGNANGYLNTELAQLEARFAPSQLGGKKRAVAKK